MPLKLHLGCGYERLPNYTNVDVLPTPATDWVQDCKKFPNLSNDSVDEICAYHLAEHLNIKEFYQAILEWWRILRPSGLLVLEVPDLAKICMEFAISDEEKRYKSYNDGPALINHIYGGQTTPYELHKFGFTKDFLVNTLSGLFENFKFGEGHKDYKIYCLRLECQKKAKAK